MTTPELKFRDFCKRFPNVVIKESVNPSWYSLLNEVFDENLEILPDLNKFLGDLSEPVNPAKKHIWAFTRFCDPSQVKVVIIGQDPYYSKYLKNVVGFSINKPNKYIPPSLKVILKEVQEDIMNSSYAPKLRGYPPRHGCLENWARQGVLLLDTVLTVTEDEPRSHRGEGWEDIVVSILNKLRNDSQSQGGALVFMLWGQVAGDLENYLDKSVNKLVLKAGHPSPKNDTDPFEGCRHFSQANDFLVAAGEKAIDWSL